jgi:hypothetical protein
MRVLLRGLLVAAVSAASMLVGLQSANAETGVTIVKTPNQAYPGVEGFFPVTLYPQYSKSGPVVVDSAVITVRNNETGALIGAGRTYVKVDPGEYKVTTTARYRTFSTIGSRTQIVAETGDIIPIVDNSSVTPHLFLSRCDVKSHTVTEDVDPPYNRHGTFTASCVARWGVGSDHSSETGYTNISGVFLGEYDGGRDIYRYDYQLGDTFVDGAPTGHGSNEFIWFDPMPAPATHDITHAFPIRKYSAQKVKQATHIVRQIVR